MLLGTSPVVQWLRFQAALPECVGSIPGGGTDIPHAIGHGKCYIYICIYIMKCILLKLNFPVCFYLSKYGY